MISQMPDPVYQERLWTLTRCVNSKGSSHNHSMLYLLRQRYRLVPLFSLISNFSKERTLDVFFFIIGMLTVICSFNDICAKYCKL